MWDQRGALLVDFPNPSVSLTVDPTIYRYTLRKVWRGERRDPARPRESLSFRGEVLFYDFLLFLSKSRDKEPWSLIGRRRQVRQPRPDKEESENASGSQAPIVHRGCHYSGTTFGVIVGTVFSFHELLLLPRVCTPALHLSLVHPRASPAPTRSPSRPCAFEPTPGSGIVTPTPTSLRGRWSFLAESGLPIVSWCSPTKWCLSQQDYREQIFDVRLHSAVRGMARYNHHMESKRVQASNGRHVATACSSAVYMKFRHLATVGCCNLQDQLGFVVALSGSTSTFLVKDVFCLCCGLGVRYSQIFLLFW